VPDKNFYLIIDEINRGDIPRIFGELLTVIERDKRMLSVTLPVSGRSFNIPGNLYVIGTMNTADRSISLLDAALRRRFGFVEMMPDSNQIRNVNAGALPLGPWLDALNERIRKVLRRDARNLQIGHAYLMTRPPITSVADFARVLRDDIIPLLEEYCYDDFAALGEILGNSLINASRGSVREELFEPNREGDLIQACNFEEIQSLVVTQGLTEGVIAPDEAEPSADDDDAGPSTSTQS
jgi:5-methylcytosine-specific restriction protein B